MVGALSSAYGVDVEGGVEGGVDVAVMEVLVGRQKSLSAFAGLAGSCRPLSDGKRTRGRPSPVGEEGPAAPLRDFERRQLRGF
ncbi:hypothetical protein GCM10017771_72110 [Streptomyces capitiformicae]|uniref:Uncharacterized protein n=1 Tax=Streptomyces capitiformicae TaxID=2014920 RepID=A0A918ZGL1_9ACTN|nr:hypothetical protein GCM10017771_72110 [Streptomyces capitiformicae]